MFKDAQTPKVPGTVAAPVTADHPGHFTHGESTYDFPAGHSRPEQPGLLFDGANIQAEDLGQFWLWNMDPYRDDFSSWHSDNDFNGLGEDYPNNLL